MARKNVLAHEKIASAQSLSASFFSTPTVIDYMDNVGYQINITTTNSIGTFAVQASLDYQVADALHTPNAGTWVNLALSGTPAAAGANDSIIIDLKQLPFSAVRIAYTSSVAGTGVADIYIELKQVGG